MVRVIRYVGNTSMNRCWRHGDHEGRSSWCPTGRWRCSCPDGAHAELCLRRYRSDRRGKLTATEMVQQDSSTPFLLGDSDFTPGRPDIRSKTRSVGSPRPASARESSCVAATHSTSYTSLIVASATHPCRGIKRKVPPAFPLLRERNGPSVASPLSA